MPNSPTSCLYPLTTLNPGAVNPGEVGPVADAESYLKGLVLWGVPVGREKRDGIQCSIVWNDEIGEM